jgi:hypothetical protein
MDVAGRDPAALQERRADEHTVYPAQRSRQRVGFGREMTAQGRIAPAGNDERRPCLPARIEQTRRNLPVERRRLGLGECARVGQDEEEWREIPKLGGQRV